MVMVTLEIEPLTASSEIRMLKKESKAGERKS